MTGSASPPPRPAGPSRWVRVVALAGPLAVVASLGLLYAGGMFGKTAPPLCPSHAETRARLDPLVQGEVAALGLEEGGRAAPSVSFRDGEGATRTLADFRGRTVLLNLWATWCIPCRQEMPALDRLQARLGGPDFAVVAVNIDTVRLDGPKRFLQAAGVTALPLYSDPTAGILQTLRDHGKDIGLPTTILVDRNGCELGLMAGPAAWDSPDAQRLIEAAKATAAPPT